MNKENEMNGKIVKESELDAWMNVMVSNREKVIFTCGCFSLIHPGHIRLLRESKELGTLLVVGLNSDKSVEKLKGNPPIVNEQGRAGILASIVYVDCVVIFDDPSPVSIIEKLEPSIFVKGPDHEVVDLEECKAVWKKGGAVKILRGPTFYNTTEMIKRIIERGKE